MPFIKKIIMQGFKSFAHPTELMLEKGLNVVVGPNGAGKCIDENSIVLLGNGRMEKIGKLVNSRLKNAVRTEEGFLIPADGTKIFCLDTKKLKIVTRPVKAFIKRKAPGKMLKIKTKTGKEIITTPYHPLFGLKEANLTTLRADELKEGMKIAIPRRINVDNGNKLFSELIYLIKKEDRIYVPYKQEFALILKNIKTKKETWRDLAEKMGVSYYVLKGLLDGQSINFASLVKILKYAKLKDTEIVDLIEAVISSNNKKKTKIVWKNSVEFSRFLGYLLAEGRLAKSSQIWFTNGNKGVVEDYIKLVRSLFDKEPLVGEYKANCWDVIIFSEPLKNMLKYFGMASKTENKYISNFFLENSSKEEIGALLSGLYAGDGHFTNSSIEITSKSYRLAQLIMHCLLRLGIVSHFKKTKKGIKSLNYIGTYYTIICYGVNNLKKFSDYVFLYHDKKRKKLLENLNKESNPNLDLIEANSLVKEIIKKLGVNVKLAKKEFPRLDAYCYNQCLPSRNGLKLLLKTILKGDSKIIKKLSLLAHSDIYWDEIIQIQEIGGKEWVYDLCVEEDHNFIANGMIVHNSNLADAICFVLGRLSVKSMRALRASNLIFHGGKEGKPATIAKVSMVFDNADNTFSLPEKDVAISRIVKKNGSSVYKINGQTKTRNEVLELLAQAGVDPYGFNIILQAEIDQFVKMHAEERREIIEDIAGISIYEERKKKSLHELEKTENKLKEIGTVLNERTAYLRNLDKEREQALRYENLKKAIRKYKACLLYKKIREKESLGGKFNKKIEEKNKIIEKQNNKINVLQEATSKIKKEIEKIDEHVKSKSGLEQESLFKEISELKSESAVVKVRLETYKEQYSSIEKRIFQLNNELSSIEKEIEKLESERGEEPEIIDYKTELKKIVNQIKKAAAGFSEISAFIEKINSYRQELQKLIDEKDVYNMSSKLQEILKEMDKECKKISKMGKIDLEKLDKILEIDMENIPQKRDVDLEVSLAKKEMDRIRNIIKKSTREKMDIKNFVEKLLKEKGIKEKEVFDKEKIGKRLTGEFQKLLADKSRLNEQLKEQEKEIVGRETEARAIENEINNLKIEKARIDAESEAFSQDFQEYKDIEEKIKEISKGHNKFEFEKKLSRAERELGEIGSVNLRALEVYDKVKAEYDEISNKVDKLRQEKDDILKIIDEVDRKKKQSFMETFNKLNEGFGNNFIRLSDKGKALLELENKEDPFSGGVDIIVKIGKGKEVDASSLSGGEKVIVAISFIFAIQEFKPYCFYIFDEIDAALDKHNSERLSGLLRNYIKQSQYIIITHNDATIGQADTLYGATMHEGISKIVSLKV